MLAIPVTDLHEVLENDPQLHEKMIACAEEINENMVSQIRTNHFNHINISLCYQDSKLHHRNGAGNSLGHPRYNTH